MKAIQVKQPGGPEALLVDLPIPQPKSNKAVVKVAACGVNFIDVYLREDRYKAPPPFVAGQEGAGVVNAIDSDVKRVGPRGSLYSRGCPAQAWLGRDLWQKMWTTHVDL